MPCKPQDKPKQKKHKKGLWSPDEDLKLRNYVLKHGHGCWSTVPINAGLQRNGKSCRLRWINYLRPGLKRGVFTKEEEETVLSLHAILGNKWSQMAQHLPGRTDNEIKNYWHSYLKKRVAPPPLGETDVTPVKESPSSLINCMESSSFSMKSTPPSSTTESTKHLDSGSLVSDTEQSVSQSHMGISREACKSNLPKVLFAEWLSLDQFRDQINCENSGNPIVDDRNFECYNSDIQDLFMHDVFVQGGMFSSGIYQGSNNGFDDMLQPALKFEDHVSENGFFGFMNGQFNIATDGLFLESGVGVI